MAETIEVSDILPGDPHQVYQAWLDSEMHSAFTGAQASIDARVGGQHAAWDGYIAGQILALEPDRKIVQSWRTTEFPDESEDSRLEILLAPAPGGTKVTIHQSQIPDGQGEQYRQGWIDHYFQPLKRYLARTSDDQAT
jgi:activator of HSP90 ATPase